MTRNPHSRFFRDLDEKLGDSLNEIKSSTGRIMKEKLDQIQIYVRQAISQSQQQIKSLTTDNFDQKMSKASQEIKDQIKAEIKEAKAEIVEAIKQTSAAGGGAATTADAQDLNLLQNELKGMKHVLDDKITTVH